MSLYTRDLVCGAVFENPHVEGKHREALSNVSVIMLAGSLSHNNELCCFWLTQKVNQYFNGMKHNS